MLVLVQEGSFQKPGRMVLGEGAWWSSHPEKGVRQAVKQQLRK